MPKDNPEKYLPKKDKKKKPIEDRLIEKDIKAKKGAE